MTKYSKNTINLADDIVNTYAEYDRYEKGYFLDYNDISEFSLQELAASMMCDNEWSASEATGPDNPAYEKNMLSSLIKFMQNPTDKDEAIEFMNNWKIGVTSYFDKAMQELIDDRLSVHAFYQKGDAA